MNNLLKQHNDSLKAITKALKTIPRQRILEIMEKVGLKPKCKPKQTNKMNTKQQKAAVLKAANELIQANNTVTTLEIKNKLRKEVPGQWFQSEISDIMNEFSNDGKFNYQVMPGGYRMYSAVTKQKAFTSGNPVFGHVNQNPQPQPAVKQKANRISRTTAADKIRNSGGRFFGATWIDKNGNEKTIRGQYLVGVKQPVMGYILVKNVTKSKEQGKTVFAQIDPRTIKAFQLGESFVIKQR